MNGGSPYPQVERELWSNTTTAKSAVDKAVLIEEMRMAIDKMRFMPSIARYYPYWVAGEWYAVDLGGWGNPFVVMDFQVPLISDWLGSTDDLDGFFDMSLTQLAPPYVHPVRLADWVLPQESKEERTVKKQFEIELPNDPSVLDITAHDLNACMKGKCHINSHLQSRVTITEITDEITDVEPGDHIVPYPTEDQWIKLHALLDGVWGCNNLHCAVEDWLHEYVFTDDDVEFPCVPYEGVTYLHGVPIFYSTPMCPGEEGEAYRTCHAAMMERVNASFGISDWIVKPPADAENSDVEDVIRKYTHDLLEWREGFYKWMEGLVK